MLLFASRSEEDPRDRNSVVSESANQTSWCSAQNSYRNNLASTSLNISFWSNKSLISGLDLCSNQQLRRLRRTKTLVDAGIHTDLSHSAISFLVPRNIDFDQDRSQESEQKIQP